MTDKIAYLVRDNGIDGRGHATIMFASFDQTECKDWYNNSKNKSYYFLDKKIVEMEADLKKALGKLTCLELLILGIEK